MDGKCSNHCIQNKMEFDGYKNANGYGYRFEENEECGGERVAIEIQRTR